MDKNSTIIKKLYHPREKKTNEKFRKVLKCQTYSINTNEKTLCDICEVLHEPQKKTSISNSRKFMRK